MKFHGYRRADGRAGIRNHVVVMPGVLCAAGVAQMIAERVKGSTYLYNPNGCAQNARDTKMTLDILSGMIANGNVYGALIVGLGCETLQKERYLAAIRQRTDKPVFHIYIQEEGGIEKTVARGVRIASTLLAEAARCKREECDIAEIILGMECGGSDTSGLSSNIVLGYLSDRLVDLGATTVISETPKQSAQNRSCPPRRTPEIGQKLYDTVKACEQLFLRPEKTLERQTLLRE